MIVSGSVNTFCSKITLPASSTTHTDVSFTDTSRPTKCDLIAPSSMLEVEPTSIHLSSQKGLHTHHPSLSRSRRDTPSVGGRRRRRTSSNVKCVVHRKSIPGAGSNRPNLSLRVFRPLLGFDLDQR